MGFVDSNQGRKKRTEIRYWGAYCYHRSGRRTFAQAANALLVALTLIMPWQSAEAGAIPQLYVFATTDMRAYAFEQELAAQLTGVEVRVFSRIREFELALKQQSPDAILARPVVLESFGKKVDLRGYRNGRVVEPFVLLSIGTSTSPNELAGSSLGVVSFVDRQAMSAFVTSVLGVPAPHLKYVNAERDLLALLQFGEVRAVVLSQWAADSLRKNVSS